MVARLSKPSGVVVTMTKKARKPNIDNGDGTFMVPLSRGAYAIIDSSQVDIVSSMTWCLHHTGYAVGYVDGKQVFMHRHLMRAPSDMQVDHINGRRLDNRTANLRICTRSENQRNRGKPKQNSSGYKGVRWHKPANKWQARIYVNCKEIALGVFVTPEQAYAAYCKAAHEIHGEFARTA